MAFDTSYDVISLKTVLGGHPVLSGRYSIPRGCLLNTGFTVLGWLECVRWLWWPRWLACIADTLNLVSALTFYTDGPYKWFRRRVGRLQCRLMMTGKTRMTRIAGMTRRTRLTEMTTSMTGMSTMTVMSRMTWMSGVVCLISSSSCDMVAQLAASQLKSSLYFNKLKGSNCGWSRKGQFGEWYLWND